VKIGLVFPQTEIGSDPAVIRDYGQTADDLGFNHIAAYEHVLGANSHGGNRFRGPYTHEHAFHEPFALFSFLAGCTTTIGLATGVLVLPQRQTALVAKQAASLDVLSSGRLRLGVGVGWNSLEFVGLGKDFHNRGKRIEEQVQLLRELWTNPLVDFEGKWHRIPEAGINPLPVQQPIPIWFGGRAEIVLKRSARLADGFMLNYSEPEKAAAGLDMLWASLEESGRERDDFGVESRVAYSGKPDDPWQETLKDWAELGCSHASINTMRQGFEGPRDHVEAIKRIALELGLRGAA
jgi:probable F420-dependent oxidoreductase